MMAAAVDITWVFLLTLYMSLNTLLWSVTRYPDVRAAHSREEVQELVNIALDIIDQCVERWPGTASASELYTILTRACLQSYDSNGTPTQSTPGSLNTPPPQADTSSPNATAGGAPTFNPPQFGYVFGAGPESDAYSLDNPFPSHPTFRSNSIFLNPASNDHTGRRFSYFPPDFTQSEAYMAAGGGLDISPPPSESATISPPYLSSPPPAQTPPDAMTPMQQQQQQQQQQSSASTMSTPLLSTPLLANTTTGARGSPDTQMLSNGGLPPQQPPQQRTPFTIPTLPQQQQQLPQGQRPLPQATTITDWFSPPPPFITPYSFAGMGANFWPGASSSAAGPSSSSGGMNGFDGGGNGLDNSNNNNNRMGMGFGSLLPPERQGSLSQAQQMELMGVLEDEGMADIDTYLSTTGLGLAAAYGGNGNNGSNNGNGNGGDLMGNSGLGMGWGV